MAEPTQTIAIHQIPHEIWTIVFEELSYSLQASVRPLLYVCKEWKVSYHCMKFVCRPTYDAYAQNIAEPIWYRHLAFPKVPAPLVKMANSLSEDATYRNKLASWTQTLVIPAHLLREVPESAMVIVRATKNLRALDLVASGTASDGIMSVVQDTIGSSLQRLHLGLRYNQFGHFGVIGACLNLRELGVHAWGTIPAVGEPESLVDVVAWELPQLETLVWSLVEIFQEQHDAFLFFLSRCRFPKLQALDVSLNYGTDTAQDNDAMIALLSNHPHVSSVKLGNDAARDSMLCAIAPSIHSRRLRVASPMLDSDFVEFLSPAVRKLEVVVFSAINQATWGILFALETEAAKMQKQGARFGIRQVAIHLSEGSFLWEDFCDWGIQIGEAFNVAISMTFRLRALGIFVVDQRGNTIGTHSVTVSCRHLFRLFDLVNNVYNTCRQTGTDPYHHESQCTSGDYIIISVSCFHLVPRMLHCSVRIETRVW
jgi:hypothetical protein